MFSQFILSPVESHLGPGSEVFDEELLKSER